MKKVLWLVLCICTLAGAAGLAASEKIVGGPFTVGVTQSAATVVWLVQSDELTMHPAAGGPAITSPSFRVETTTLTGLKPDTRYEYAIPSGGEEGSGSFKTAPREGTPYRFVVYGDTRTRHDVHRNVISQILKGLSTAYGP